MPCKHWSRGNRSGICELRETTLARGHHSRILNCKMLCGGILMICVCQSLKGGSIPYSCLVVGKMAHIFGGNIGWEKLHLVCLMPGVLSCWRVWGGRLIETGAGCWAEWKLGGDIMCFWGAIASKNR